MHVDRSLHCVCDGVGTVYHKYMLVLVIRFSATYPARFCFKVTPRGGLRYCA